MKESIFEVCWPMLEMSCRRAHVKVDEMRDTLDVLVRKSHVNQHAKELVDAPFVDANISGHVCSLEKHVGQNR